ncbi:IS66-like element accessory protein TnpA [Jiella pacifica]|uniref:Transposase n=1 Tax=Jiella pacifica TaxID=2696469 RepID=A0A6N9T9E7_9HYPH|nr:transposase [Jiella pacifica]NDW07910.1 transposase [Jiella pacifica]
MACAKVISDFEVLAAGDAGRRRGWSDEEKVRIVEESLRGYRQGSTTAGRYGISRSLLTRWRAQYRSGQLETDGLMFAPLTLAAETAQASVCERQSRAPTASAATIEVLLRNGRRITVPASIDPAALARLLPVLDGL